jgi:hypothetical protein
MSKWRKLRELSWSQRCILVEAAAALLFVKVTLPFIAFRAELLDADTRRQPPAPERVSHALVIARLVNVAAAHAPFALTCLHRSVALWRLLRRRGTHAELRLGAHRPDGTFEAHAWVECNGVPLDDQSSGVSSYRPFGRAVVPRGGFSPGRLVTRRVG